MERDQPFDLTATAQRLGRSVDWVRSMVIDRRGEIPGSGMVTTGLHAVLGSGRRHRLAGTGGLVEEGVGSDAPASDSPTADLTLQVGEGRNDHPPRHRSMLARWGAGRRAERWAGRDDNLLGNSVTVEIDGDDSELSIPLVEADTAGLRYYGALPVTTGETVLVGGPAFPVWLVDYGKDYVDGYLLTERGGGFYLEWHTDRPHWHQPLSADAAGFYVLGRQVAPALDGLAEYHLTAFRIPPGTAVFTAPGTIHCDAALTGTWAVGYSDSAHYSTALVRNRAGAMVRFTADVG